MLNIDIENRKIISNANRVKTSKYNFITFLPHNLFDQLSKPSTFYFFVTLCLQFIPSISPFEPWDYLLAFSIVVGTSMIKDGLEDYQRHIEDHALNSRRTNLILKDLKLEETSVEKLNSGDIVLFEKNEQISADVILLKGYELNRETNKFECINHCFIETSNLDGETNLKKKAALVNENDHKALDDFRCDCIRNYKKNIKSIAIEEPNDSFTEFDCKIEINQDQRKDIKVGSVKNAILRGSILKNTSLIACLVINVGNHTKQAMSINTDKKSTSVFEQKINWTLGLVFGIYAVMLFSTTGYGAYYNSNLSTFEIIKFMASSYILYSYLVPLSLFLMIEICKIYHAYIISIDKDMFRDLDGTNVNSRCRNTAVIEDLGSIDYILTDKTGTLTENSMTLKLLHNFTTGQKNISNLLEEIITSNINNLSGENREKELFLLNMLICNSVEIYNDNYEGISQEELSILNLLKEHGYFFESRTPEKIILNLNGAKLKVYILSNLDFSSKRQRQSIICKINGKILLFTKGSDQKLLADSIDKSEDIADLDKKAKDYINNVNEYRTLVFKYKILSKEEYDEFKTNKQIAINLLNNHSMKISSNEKLKGKYEKYNNLELLDDVDDAFYKEIETNTIYVGSSLIEDKLSENIHSTLTMLRSSSIKLWMITGDKKETGVACAINSGLADNNDFFSMEGQQLVNRLENKEDLDEIFRISSIVVYRATPAQKGKIAKILRNLDKKILAIGDGNNDVAMLKIAHVGVGIIGKEGRQAVLNSDFALPTFSCLRRLILYHGRFNLLRYSKIVTNSFYKNLFFIIIQYLYNFYNGGTGYPFYKDSFMNYYNLIYTSMIPMSIGFFERDKEIFKSSNGIYWETIEEERAAQEYDFHAVKTYKHIQAYFTKPIILAHIIGGVLQSIILFFSIRFMFNDGISNSSGKMLQSPGESIIISTIIFLSVINSQYRIISFINKYSYIAVFLSFFFAIFFTFGLNGIDFLHMNIFESEIVPKVFTNVFTYFILAGGLILTYSLDTLFLLYIDNRIKKMQQSYK
ncbi:AT8A1 [Hepatospora eriocheir]|uniref:AT8A1 n=1 Tax=Hepatospora eriocheir TaxID=1081669 RepID=A0A1X0QA41_9MICR|nr:AT8A1 [Hepatospora eriocheir]